MPTAQNAALKIIPETLCDKTTFINPTIVLETRKLFSGSQIYISLAIAQTQNLACLIRSLTTHSLAMVASLETKQSSAW